LSAHQQQKEREEEQDAPETLLTATVHNLEVRIAMLQMRIAQEHALAKVRRVLFNLDI
jgi:uncharacterized small protein (DUF1192 family)